MKKILLFNLLEISVLLLLMSYSTSVVAQQDKKIFFGMGYNINHPLNNTFTDKTGFWGGYLDAEYYFDKTYSIGFNGSWNTLLKYIPTKTYKRQDQPGNITTDMYHSVFNIPLTVYGRYHFMQNDRFKPFVGLALGAQFTDFSQYYSLYQDNQTSWGLTARPEAGTVIRLTKNENINMILGVDYSFSTTKNKNLSINNMQGLGFKIGVQIALENSY